MSDLDSPRVAVRLKPDYLLQETQVRRCNRHPLAFRAIEVLLSESGS